MHPDALNLMDPELRGIAVQMQPMLEQFTPMTQDRLEPWRTLMASNIPPPRGDIAVDRQQAASSRAPGQAATVYVVNARQGASRPGLLHLHGGGFTGGSAAASLRQVQDIAEALDCTVVSVDYRLAPETPWTGSLEDNYAALCWLHDHAPRLGVDPAKIAVIGESAGGGHAVLLCAAARERGGPSVRFLSLAYPMLDDRTGSTRSLPGHLGAVGWSADANRFGWSSFLGQEPGGADVAQGAVPARLADLAGFPPTFVGVGGLDLFVEEDIEFVRRLVLSGVPAELLVLPGAFHGFDTVAPDAEISKRFTRARIAALRNAFAQGA